MRSTRVLAGCAIAAVYLLLRFHLIDIPLGRDEGGYAYVGREILAGGVPYRDAFDLRPPGPFYLYALALLVAPPTPAGIHVFLHAYNLLTLLALASLARALGGDARVALWTALGYAVLSSLPGVQGFQASSELLMLLPLVLCARLALASRRRLGALFLAGACGALACWIKQSAFLSLAFLPVWIAVDARRERRGAAAELSSFAGGGVAVSLAILAGFAAAGVLPELLYWSFRHPFLYAGSGWLPGRVGAQLLELLGGSPAISLAAGLGALAMPWVAPRQAAFVLPFLLLSLLATLPGKAYEHYFCQLLPALALAAGWSFAEIVARVRPPYRLFAGGALAALAAALPLAIAPGYYATQSPDEIARAEFGVNPFVESPEIAGYLRAHSAPDDRVLIVGSEPQILFLSGRRSATPFIYFYPVLEPYPRHVEFQERIWADVSARPPSWILHVDLTSSLALDARADRRLIDRLQNLIAHDYRPRAVVLIERPRGRLIPLDGAALPFLRSAIEHAAGRVYLYQRRSELPANPS